MKVVVRGARLAFSNIWEPRSFAGGGDARCSGSFILDPKAQNAEVAKIIAAINQVAQEKWGAKAADVLKTLKVKGDVCLHDGAVKAEYDGFDGNVYLSASNKVRPVVVNKDKSPLTEGDGVVYSGCYVNVSVDIWPQDNKYGKRVNAKLIAVQFDKDGAAFSGGEGYNPDTDFADESGEGGAAPWDAGGGDADGFFN